jgi:hypothetical protein
MAKKNITSTTQDLQDFNKASAELVSVLNDLAKALGDNAKAAERFTGDSAKNYTENFREAVSLGNKLSGYTADQLKDRKEEVKFLKDLSKLQQEQSRVQSKIAVLQDKLVNAKGKEADYIKKALDGLKEVDKTIEASVDHAEDLKKTFEEISKQSKFFDNLSDLVKEVPLLSNVFGEFQKASDAARNAAAEGKNGFAAGAKQLGGVFTKFIAAFTIGKIVSGLKDFDERTVAIGRNLNVSREESDRMVMSMNKAARSIQGLTGKDLTDSVVGFSNALGTSAVISRETAKTLATQTKYLGMSSEEANSLAIYAAGTKQDYTEMVESITGEVILSNKRNKLGIDYKAVTRDIAKTSNATKSLIQGQGKSLAQAGIEAKKLGSTIEEIAAAGKNMLNFEESIAAELEAELLSGKEINNEKARAAALMGDQEALAKALQEDQALQKFDAAKTVLEQEAIAKAYGLQLDQMANMSAEAKAMKNFKVEDKASLDAAMSKELERIELLKKQGKAEEAKAAMQQLQKDVGNKALIDQRQNQTVADKQAEAMAKMGEAMDKLNTILKPIAAAFEFIGKNVDLITKGLLLMTALMGPAKLGGMVKNLGGMFKGVAGKVTAAAGAGGGIAGAAGAAGAGGAAAGAGAAGAGAAGAGGAAAGGGGFFKNLFSGAKGMLSKLNPFTALKSSIKGMGGIGGFLKTALKKIPGLNTILTGFFAYQDIKSLLENPVDDKGNPLGKEAINQQIGKIVMGGLGGILGGAVGTALGGPIGTIIGSIGGDALFKWIAGTFPDASEALGGAVRPIFESSPEKEPRKMATGGIVSGATKAIVGEAGPEAVVPLTAFYAKIDELITAVKQSGNISIGANKLNEAIGMNLHPMR